MSASSPDSLTETGAAQRSLVDDVRAAVDDAKALALAELAYHKSRLVLAGQGAKAIAGLAVLALVLVYFALMALVMGLLLGLGRVLGPWGALGVVVLALLALAGVSGALALGRWRRLSRVLADQGEVPE